MSEFEWVNKYYKLNVEKGIELIYQGEPCEVIGADGPYLKVRRKVDNAELLLHPTWKVEYPK